MLSLQHASTIGQVAACTHPDLCSLHAFNTTRACNTHTVGRHLKTMERVSYTHLPCGGANQMAHGYIDGLSARYSHAHERGDEGKANTFYLACLAAQANVVEASYGESTVIPQL